MLRVLQRATSLDFVILNATDVQRGVCCEWELKRLLVGCMRCRLDLFYDGWQRLLEMVVSIQVRRRPVPTRPDTNTAAATLANPRRQSVDGRNLCRSEQIWCLYNRRQLACSQRLPGRRK